MTTDRPSRERRPTRYLDGEELKRRRDAAKYTQAKLASLADSPQNRVTQDRVAHWELGDDGPGVEVIIALAAALPDCTATDLMHDEGRARYADLLKALKAA